MRIDELKLTHFRGLLNTEIKFHPGFNLIVGVNGAGKSSVLDALRILLSQVLPMFAKAPRFKQEFKVGDIMVGRSSTQAQITFVCHGSEPYTYVVHKNREQHIANADGGMRDQTTETPDKNELTSSKSPGSVLAGGPAEFKKRPSQPIVLYFSVWRAHSDSVTSKVGHNANPGYFGALTPDRGLRILDLVQWWQVKEQIASEDHEGTSARQLQAVRVALQRLLPEFDDWRLEADELWVTKRVVIEMPDPESRTGGVRRTEELRPLHIRQLSDGERSMIAFVFDLARRLAQLNENDSDPAANGEGIVLIDEIDLHLHPEWQRRIVDDLCRTFPRIQFICTSHSPQIIGQVASENVILLGPGGGQPAQTFGMDSNWILRHIMGSDDRDPVVAGKLDAIFEDIESGAFDSAQQKINALRTEIGDHPDLVEAEALVSRYTRFDQPTAT